MNKPMTARLTRAALLALGAAAILGIGACNTVRGVAKDVTAVADAVDPSKQE